MNNDGNEDLNPLFPSSAEYEAFKERHSQHKVPRRDLESYDGKAYLGIDAGSTTTKIALIAEDGGLLYSYYGSNQGNPLESTMGALKELS
jgi:activator of 2-hydroxyglutaryl-CoA dehydratase